MSVDLSWVCQKSVSTNKNLQRFIGVELVGPKKRVLTGTLVSSCYALGEVFAAGSAWIFHDWRFVITSHFLHPIIITGVQFLANANFIKQFPIPKPIFYT